MDINIADISESYADTSGSFLYRSGGNYYNIALRQVSSLDMVASTGYGGFAYLATAITGTLLIENSEF